MQVLFSLFFNIKNINGLIFQCMIQHFITANTVALALVYVRWSNKAIKLKIQKKYSSNNIAEE